MSRFTSHPTMSSLQPQNANPTRLSEQDAKASVPLEDLKLSPQDEQQVQALMRKLETCDVATVLRYGQKLQERIAMITSQTLEAAVKRDADAVLNLLQTINVSLQDYDESLRCPGTRLIKTAETGLSLQAQHCKMTDALSRAKTELEGRRLALQVDMKMLVDTEHQLSECDRQLHLRLIAGKRLLERTSQLDLTQPTKVTDLDIANLEKVVASDKMRRKRKCLEMRLQDLQISRTLCMQLMTQVRARFNATSLLVSNVQEITERMIPIWQQNAIAALSLQDLEQTMRLDNSNLRGAITSMLDAYAEFENEVAKIRER